MDDVFGTHSRLEPHRDAQSRHRSRIRMALMRERIEAMKEI
jgi:hypothetical protein